MKKPKITMAQVQKFKLSQLKAADYNPRTISADALAGLTNSISRFGCVEPIVVNIRGGANTIIGGHQRLRALKKLKVKEAVCVTVNCSKKDEKLLNLTLNNPAIQGEFIAKIGEYIEAIRADIPDADYIGLKIDQLRGEIEEAKEGLTDDDQVPEPPKKAKTKKGDLYILGKHRLLCGDATKAEDVERLMDGKKADMVFTDPPYGIDYQSNMRIKSKKFKPIKNDSTFLISWIEPAKTFSYGWILFFTSWKVLSEWLKIGAKIGELSNMIIWDKGGGGIGDLSYSLSTDYEIILAYGRGNEIIGKRVGSVWSIGKDIATEYKHPTQKPVELAIVAINTFCSGDVLDLFLGSGSTLIACEKLNRKCFGMEIDPIYCDVIVKRWQDFTGKKARLIRGKKRKNH